MVQPYITMLRSETTKKQRTMLNMLSGETFYHHSGLC